jgi:hypothetical protein
LAQLLTGRTDIFAKFGLSVQLELDKWGMHLQYSVSRGVRDVLETRANGYGFIDNVNKRQARNVLIGIFLKIK